MLAKQIIKLRRMEKMTQQQLAEKIEAAASTVGMYEQGKRNPSVDTLIRLANIFEVSLDYLITGKESDYGGLEDCRRKRCPCRCRKDRDDGNPLE